MFPINKKIVDRAGVSNDEPHCSESQLLKRSDFPPQLSLL